MQAYISEKDLVIQGETVPISYFVSLKHFADCLFTSRTHIHLLHYYFPYICIYSFASFCNISSQLFTSFLQSLFAKM